MCHSYRRYDLFRNFKNDTSAIWDMFRYTLPVLKIYSSCFVCVCFNTALEDYEVKLVYF